MGGVRGVKKGPRKGKKCGEDVGDSGCEGSVSLPRSSGADGAVSFPCPKVTAPTRPTRRQQ